MSPNRSRGFSLIELMIAVSLGMLAIAAVGSVFIYGSRSYKEDDRVSRMQDELRFAMAQLSADLEMAGFFAQTRNLVNDLDVHGSATVETDCGPTTDGGVSGPANNWTYMERRASVFTRGDATAAQANAAFPCIDTDEFYTGPRDEGTDIIAIKRLSGSNTLREDENNNTVYMKTNGVQSVLYRHQGGAGARCTVVDNAIRTACSAANPPPSSGNIEIYEFKPVVWFVRKWPQGDSGTIVPSLCRKYLGVVGGEIDFVTECLAQGIEDLQLEFGVDTNANGVPDFYTEYDAMPDLNTLATIVAVRAHLLARAVEPDQGYTNVKSFTLAGRTHAAFNDKYHRRTLSSTIVMRNPANLLTPQELPQ